AMFACVFHLMSRDLQALASVVDDAIGSQDFPSAVALGLVARGRLLSANGDHRSAVGVMRDGIAAYRATGQRITLPFVLAVLAETLGLAGDPSGARACVAEARDVAESTRDVHCLAEVQRVEAMLLADDDRDEAERCATRAVAVAREHGARWWEL